jgi:hypothetical protein
LLSEVALMLEAAIQKGDLGEGGYDAWILLGEIRNMDEREDLGLRALAEGVKRAEAAGSHGPGIIVCYFLPMLNSILYSLLLSVYGHVLHERRVRQSLIHNVAALAPNPISISSRSPGNGDKHSPECLMGRPHTTHGLVH